LAPNKIGFFYRLTLRFRDCLGGRRAEKEVKEVHCPLSTVLYLEAGLLPFKKEKLFLDQNVSSRHGFMMFVISPFQANSTIFS
jgi:hypothetical protein